MKFKSSTKQYYNILTITYTFRMNCEHIHPVTLPYASPTFVDSLQPNKSLLLCVCVYACVPCAGRHRHICFVFRWRPYYIQKPEFQSVHLYLPGLTLFVPLLLPCTWSLEEVIQMSHLGVTVLPSQYFDHLGVSALTVTLRMCVWLKIKHSSTIPFRDMVTGHMLRNYVLGAECVHFKS